MTKLAGIYAIVHTATGCRYIGSTHDLVGRERFHWYRLRKRTHHCRKLGAAYKKHGRGAFRFVVLERLLSGVPKEIRKTLHAREQHYLNVSRRGLFNAGKCSLSSLGVKRVRKTRQKLSAAIVAAWARPDVRARMVKAIRLVFKSPADKARRARVCADPEYRRLMSEAVRKAHAQPAVRKKISEGTRAALANPATRRRLSRASKAMHARPGFREKHAAATKAALARPEVKEKLKRRRRRKYD